MNRKYTIEQRKNGVEQERYCREYLSNYGINLSPIGNCVERFCPHGCNDCIDDEFCKPDYKVVCIPATIEVTGHNPTSFSRKQGLYPEEPLFLTHCKVRNFINAFKSGKSVICYVWHYSKLIRVCAQTNRHEVVQPNVIRIIKMNGEFLDAYYRRQFPSETIGCENFISIPFDSDFVISLDDMRAEMEILADQYCPDHYRYAPWN